MFVSVHSSVLLCIAEHLTRLRASSLQSCAGAAGVLLGFEDTRGVLHVCDAFETPMRPFDGVLFARMRESHITVYPHWRVIGVYAVKEGKSLVPEKEHLDVLGVLKPYLGDGTSLLMLVSPMLLFDAGNANEVMPVAVFIDGTEKKDFKIEFGDAERIAVDHVAKEGQDSAGVCPEMQELKNMCGSVKQLRDNLQTISDFLSRTSNGEIEFNHPIMRQIGSICNQLARQQSAPQDEREAQTEKEAEMIALLACLTNTMDQMETLVHRMAVASPNTWSTTSSQTTPTKRKRK